jgi:hypothetical protein
MRDPTDASDAPQAGGNVADTNSVIRECVAQFNEISEKRGELNAEAADIRERLDEAGVNKPAFQAARTLYNMEPEGRDSYQDNMRLCMDALGLGQQGTLLPSDTEVIAAGTARHDGLTGTA